MVKAKKKWGQNFLQCPKIINHLVDAIRPTQKDSFIEIGPGYGALTQHIANFTTDITAIEIDPDCTNLLKKKYPNLNIINENVLCINWETLSNKKRIVGNLPYCISSEILKLLCKNHRYLSDAHIMLQKEVADRILSSPGDRSFSRLSIFMQAHFDVEHIIDIQPESFTPKPSVMSSFIRLIAKTNPNPINPICHSIIQAAFSQRRKMVRNSLSSFLSAEDMIQIGIDGTKRAQELSREEYDIISSFSSQIGKKR